MTETNFHKQVKEMAREVVINSMQQQIFNLRDELKCRKDEVTLLKDQIARIQGMDTNLTPDMRHGVIKELRDRNKELEEENMDLKKGISLINDRIIRLHDELQKLLNFHNETVSQLNASIIQY